MHDRCSPVAGARSLSTASLSGARAALRRPGNDCHRSATITAFRARRGEGTFVILRIHGAWSGQAKRGSATSATAGCHEGRLTGHTRAMGDARDWVLHVDLDQFIAAVEVLRHPELAGRPVIVGGRGDPTERAVVSTASYEARAKGVGSGMPLRTAAKRCPDAVFLPSDPAAYDEASAQVVDVLRA